MKKLWKALGITALAAAVIPVKFEKDETTGKKTYQSLLMSLGIGPGSGEDKVAIDVNIGEGVLGGIIASAVTKQEDAMFADDEPEAAVVDAPLTEIIEEAVEAAGDAVEAAVEEVIAGAEDGETAEPTEEDFDPEL